MNKRSLVSPGVIWIAAALAVAPACAQSMTDEAQSIYESSHPSVVQIQVIDLATGKKTSIGSGFQFTPEGHIATNFHVVAEAVHSPARFRVESIRHDGVTDPAEVLDIDVIHDLAIIRPAPLPRSGAGADMRVKRRIFLWDTRTCRRARVFFRWETLLTWG